MKKVLVVVSLRVVVCVLFFSVGSESVSMSDPTDMNSSLGGAETHEITDQGTELEAVGEVHTTESINGNLPMNMPQHNDKYRCSTCGPKNQANVNMQTSNVMNIMGP